MKALRHLAFFSLLFLTIFVGFQYMGKAEAAGIAANNLFDEQELPTVGSAAKLKEILKEAEKAQRRMGYHLMADGGVAMMLEKAAPAEAAADTVQGSGQAEYSETNIQVEGVDEADTVKTDGKFIYLIKDRQVVITEAYPANRLKIMAQLNYQDHEFHPREMYVDDKYLIVIGDAWTSMPFPNEPVVKDEDAKKKSSAMIHPRNFDNSMKVKVYDIADKNSPVQVREVEVNGSYLSSRKIGDNVYFVSNKNIPVYGILEDNQPIPYPVYRDSLEGEQVKEIGPEHICYFPESKEPSYLIVAALNLDNMTEDTFEVNTYLGAGSNVYSSLENLYVSVAEMEYIGPLPEPRTNGGIIEPDIIGPDNMEVKTSIYKFGLNDGEICYQSKGSIPGTILNQFSMDEYKGYLRIAATENKLRSGQEPGTENNVYILDENLTITGSIENIAPGERIYSARFMSNKGYMVTFKTVDPLFVLDLEDPDNPTILGELKIPGYSNYLHPYDENHIIGFGKDTIEVEERDYAGNTYKNAYYLGMKIAMFDVSNVSNPVEKFKIEIGDRGTDSELFHNHKALMFDHEKGIMAFPVNVHQISSNNKDDYLAQKDPRLAYGEPAFQGAYIYRISDEAFNFQGRISHHEPEDLRISQRAVKYDYASNISRILYIGDHYYTVSQKYLQSHEMSTLRQADSLLLK